MAAGAALAPAAGAQTPSDDASLRSLSIESDIAQTRMFPEFDPDVDRYDVAVPSGETEVTVKVATNHSGASVVLESTREGRCCTDELDYDANTDAHALELWTEGHTSMTIKVTAEDGSTTREYVVYVDVASSDAKGWRVYNDVPMERLVVPMDRLVDEPQLPEHYIRGLWADDSRVLTTAQRHGTKDGEFYLDQKLYAFDAADSSRLPDEEFVLSGRPYAGIWADGTTLWALDTDGTLRAYSRSDGSEISGLSTDVSRDGYYDTREVDAPRGIWSDGDTLWVVDRDNTKVVAFTLPGPNCLNGNNYCRQSDKDFDLHADNDNPWGITAGKSSPTATEIDTWWVTNVTEDKTAGRTLDKRLFAYAYSEDSEINGTRIEARDIDLKETLNLISWQQYFYGLAATNTIMYVAEYITNRVYSFSMPGVSGAIGPALVSSDATLSDLSLRAHMALSDAALDPEFSPEQTHYFAYVEPDDASITVTVTPNPSAEGAVVKVGGTIAANGVVALNEGTNGMPGITTILIEVTAQDGTTKKTYTVTVHRRAKSTDATLGGLVLSGVPFNFDPSTFSYTPDAVANSVAQTTVTATPNSEHAKSVVINGTDVTNDNGALVVALDAQEVDDPVVNTITVEVTAEDGTMTETYTVTVTRERLPSNIATLDMLELEDVELDRTFASDHSPYTSTVDNGVSSTVIKFKRTNQFATVAIQAVDPNAITTVVPAQDIVPSGTSLQLAEGVNTVTVTVTSEDMTDTMDYVLTITRAEPSNVATLASLSFNPGALSRNGASATFDAVEALYDVDVLHDDDSTELSYRKTNSTATVEIGVGGTVVQGTDGLTVTGETTLHSSDASDPPSGSVSVPLATVGSYTVTVGVTAEDTTTTNLYVFTITRPVKPQSNDATLGELTVKDAESNFDVVLDPAFASGDTGKTYKAKVRHGVMSIAVHAKPKNHPVATAQLTIGNQPVGTPATLASDAGQTVSLTQGTNVLRIDVTAEDGSDETYEIEVEQLPPGPRTNTRLANLVLRDLSQTVMKLTQASAPEVTEFAPEVTEYKMTVDHGVTKLEVLPSLEDPDGAMVDITGADPGGFVSLDVDENTIEVVVTAEDVNFTETYTVTVTRDVAPATDVAALSSLTLKREDLDLATLDVRSGTTDFTVDVDNGVDAATVRAVATSANATIAVTLVGQTSTTAKEAVSLDVQLALEDNVITVVVTAEDDSTKKTYTVTVNRAAPDSQPPVNLNPGTSNPGTYNPGTSNPGTSNPGGGSSNSGSSTVGESSGDGSDSSEDESDDVTPLDDAGDAGTETEAAINALHRLGVFTGTLCQSNRLCPNDPMQRWIAAVWLVRLIDGDDPAAVTESRFEDVNASSMWEDSVWYAPHVERLADLEVTVGCTQDPLRFCPDANLTRAQVASWVARAFDLESAESQGFVDAVGSVHEANINAVVAAGVMSGCSTDPKNFCLDDTVTKGEMARYVYAARNVSLGLS